MEEGACCYICENDSDPAPASQCACKGRFIHDICLIQMVGKTGTASCSVCRAPFRNVSLKTTERRAFTKTGGLVVCVHFLSACVGGWIAWFAATCWPPTIPIDWAGVTTMFLIQVCAFYAQINILYLHRQGAFQFFTTHMSCRVQLSSPINQRAGTLPSSTAASYAAT